MSNSQKFHQHALAAAVAVALGFAGTASAAGRVDTAGLHSKDQTSFDQFIVKYRAGTNAAAQQHEQCRNRISCIRTVVSNVTCAVWWMQA